MPPAIVLPSKPPPSRSSPPASDALGVPENVQPSSRLARIATPGLAPSLPAAPGAPSSPLRPCRPMSPVAPCAPAGPASPFSPCGPGAPRAAGSAGLLRTQCPRVGIALVGPCALDTRQSERSGCSRVAPQALLTPDTLRTLQRCNGAARQIHIPDRAVPDVDAANGAIAIRARCVVLRHRHASAVVRATQSATTPIQCTQVSHAYTSASDAFHWTASAMTLAASVRHRLASGDVAVRDSDCHPVHFRVCANLMDSVRTGRPAFETTLGMPVFEYLAQNPDYSEVFNGAMTALSAPVAGAAIEAYDFSQYRLIVDVAGGHGEVLASILKASPGSRGVLAEVGHVVEGARRRITGPAFQIVARPSSAISSRLCRPAAMPM